VLVGGQVSIGRPCKIFAPIPIIPVIMGSPIPDSPKEWAVAEGLKLGGRSNNHVNTIYSKQN
jgi:hypothetical protein